jgi:flagellar hook-length control protein FliK
MQTTGEVLREPSPRSLGQKNQKNQKAVKNSKLGAFALILEGLRTQKRTPALLTKDSVPLEKAQKKPSVQLAARHEKAVKTKSAGEQVTELIVVAGINPQQQPVPEMRAKKTPVALIRTVPDTSSAKSDPVQKPTDKQAPVQGSTLGVAKNRKQVTKPAVSADQPAPDAEKPKQVSVVGTDKKESQQVKKPDKARPLSVHDIRTSSAQEPVQQGTAATQPAVVNQSAQTDTADLVVNLGTDRTSMENSAVSGEGSPVHSFEDALARELQNNLSGDIVRQAQVVLKNGNAGTIKLSLHPESLGNVKVHLEMVENKLIGHIVVDSAETLRAFEREVHSLEQAFRDSGFQTAQLDTRLAGGGGSGGEGRQEQEPRQFFSDRLIAASYDSGDQDILPIHGDSDLVQINMLA